MLRADIVGDLLETKSSQVKAFLSILLHQLLSWRVAGLALAGLTVELAGPLLFFAIFGPTHFPALAFGKAGYLLGMFLLGWVYERLSGCGIAACCALAILNIAAMLFVVIAFAPRMITPAAGMFILTVGGWFLCALAGTAAARRRQRGGTPSKPGLLVN